MVTTLKDSRSDGMKEFSKKIRSIKDRSEKSISGFARKHLPGLRSKKYNNIEEKEEKEEGDTKKKIERFHQKLYYYYGTGKNYNPHKHWNLIKVPTKL